MHLKIQSLIYKMKERGLDMFTSEILQEEAALIERATLELYNSIANLSKTIASKDLGTYKNITCGTVVEGQCRQYNLSIVLGKSNQPMVRVVFAKEDYEVTEKQYFKGDEYHNFLVLIQVPSNQNEVLGLEDDWLQRKLEARLKENENEQ